MTDNLFTKSSQMWKTYQKYWAESQLHLWIKLVPAFSVKCFAIYLHNTATQKSLVADAIASVLKVWNCDAHFT